MSEKTTPQEVETPEVTDEQLRELGLKKSVAYLKDNSGKSGSAKRKEKSREKQKEAGIEQVTVAAAEPVRQIVKQLAERTKAGESIETVLASLVPATTQQPAATPETHTIDAGALEIGRQVLRLRGWKKTLISWLLA